EVAVGHIIDMVERRTAGSDTPPPAMGSPVPWNDAFDAMLQAVSAVVKAHSLDDDVRWCLIRIIMQSLEDGTLRLSVGPSVVQLISSRPWLAGAEDAMAT